MFGAHVSGAVVVVVAEVPGLAWVDAVLASPACGFAGFDLWFDLFAEFLVVIAVAALGGGALCGHWSASTVLGMERISGDVWLRVGAAVWVVLIAALAYTFSVWLCGAVLVGAAVALVEHARR